MNNLNNLRERTILSAELLTNPSDGGHDAPDTLVLYFTDGTTICIYAEATIHSKSYEPWAQITLSKELE